MQHLAEITVELLTFSTPNTDLLAHAKRYIPSYRTLSAEDGVTLLFAHCVGSYKEQWELVISHLIAQQCEKSARYRIREAICFDWQSHGDSAIANATQLAGIGKGAVKLNVWADAISYYVSQNLRGHRLVGVGHSAGATAILLSTQSAVPYQAFVLIEPSMLTRETYAEVGSELDIQLDFVIKNTLSRKALWKSKEMALDYFKKRLPWGMWSEQALSIHAEHALTQDASGAFILKTSPALEASSYWSHDELFVGMDRLEKLSPTVPVHVVWGDRCDVVPEHVQEALTGTGSGISFASVVRIQDAGHMLVQERPFEIAKVMEEMIAKLKIEPQSKL